MGTIEGISYLLLVLVAMPLKYFFGLPQMVTVVGSAHGALWILYLLTMLPAGREHRWPIRMYLLGGVASVLPFGPFLFDPYAERMSGEVGEAA